MPELLKCGGRKTHTVLKDEDIKKHLNAMDRLQLATIMAKIWYGRKIDNKDPTPEYIIINTDEPYIDEIIDVLKRHNAWGQT